MAIKIKRKGKKSTDPELLGPDGEPLTGDPLLDEPDAFIQTAGTTVSWASDNQNLLLIGVGAVIVVIFVGAFLIQNNIQARLDRAAVLTEAVEVMAAPVGEQPQLPPGATAPSGPRFATDKQKYTELNSKADAVLAEYDGTDVAETARLAKARAALGLGNFDEAISLYNAWLTANQGAPEAAFVLQALATAQASGGKVDDAVGTLKKLKGVDEEAYGELVSVQIAKIYESAGQKDKAKAAYEEMIKAYPDGSQVEFAKMRIEMM